MENSKLKVLIVSGSLAGLTLAHCLEHAGLAYPVLEKHRIAPEIGASLGIMPNGGRIFDQLEKYTDIEALTAPIQAIRFTFNDGYSVLDRIVSTFNARYGYPLMFLERRRILEVLYAKLEHKSAVITHKEVASIEQTEDHTRITTQDGSTYDGDIVLGADRVYSIIRSEMLSSLLFC